MPNYDPRWLKNPWDVDQGGGMDAEQIPTAKIPSLEEELARQWLQNGPIQASAAPKFDADAAAAQWFRPMGDMGGAGVTQGGAPELPKGVMPSVQSAPAAPSSHIFYKYPEQSDWQDAKKTPAPYTDPNGFGQSWTSSGGGTYSQPNADYQQYRRNLYGDAEVAAEDANVAKSKALEQAYKQVNPVDLIVPPTKASEMVKVPTGGVDANGQPAYHYVPKTAAGTFSEPAKLDVAEKTILDAVNSSTPLLHNVLAKIAPGIDPKQINSQQGYEKELAKAQSLDDSLGSRVAGEFETLKGKAGLGYGAGWDELIPQLEHLKVLASGPYRQGSRNYQYIKQIQGFIPDPGGTPKSNAQKALNLLYTFNQIRQNAGLDQVPPGELSGGTSTATSAPTAPTSQFKVLRRLS